MADQNPQSGPDEATVMNDGVAIDNGAGRAGSGANPEDRTVAATSAAKSRGEATPGSASKTVVLSGAVPVPSANIAPMQEMQHTPPAHTPSILGSASSTSNEQSGSASNSQENTSVHAGAALPKPGTRISHYEVIREIGAGGMGTVYLARDTRLGRRVAIKFLHTNHPELTQRFILEARTTARCQHENIVIIYEVGEFNQQPFMVLEYLHGNPLSKFIEGGQKLPPARAVELMVPVIKALIRAHEEGIVHRDLKPDNIFVTDSGTIKVLDFGIAKVLQHEQHSREASSSSAQIALPTDEELTHTGKTELTRHGAIMGTMSYMSPEQWGIGVEIDHRTDIWATGIMLYRMIAGKHPLAPLRGQQLIVTAMLNRPMPSLASAAPGCPKGLAQLVDRCLLKHKEERFEDARELLRSLDTFIPGRFTRELQIDETPYAGLSSFQEGDADKFFGRTDEITAAVTRIRQQPLMAVVGSSGVGKSSFVRAGLVPALKQSGEDWETLVIRPGRDPLAALASIVSPMVGTSTSVADDVSEHRKLVEKLLDQPGYLGTVLRSRARREGRKILLFIDQFEELYTLIPDVADRRAFTACLSGVADDATAPLRVVLSIRSDFLDRVPEDPRFMSELNQGLFFLTPPNRDGLRDAIIQPAEMAGYHFENLSVVENMLDHLASAQGALPLLQFAATKLWEARDQARKMLTQSSYDAIGGIAGALAAHADAVLQELPPRSQKLVSSVFTRLVTPERTRAIVSLEELCGLSREHGEIQRLVDHLVQARLLVVQTSGEAEGGTSVEIVHESLVHSWPTLRRWLDDNQDDAVFLEQLRNAAKQWQAKRFDSGLLWRGDANEEAKRWFKRYTGELPEVQRKFLNAGFSQQQRAQRRRRALLIAVVAFLTMAVAASAVALVIIRESEQDAQAQRDKAQKAEKTALFASRAAQEAESKAKNRLAEVIEAQKQKKAAEAKVTVAEVKVDQTNEQLRRKNLQLEGALKEAEESKRRAKSAAKIAEENAAAATAARNEALTSKQEVERLLTKERDRAARLEKQLGSGLIDKLE